MSYNSPFTGNVIQPTDVSYREINLNTVDIQLDWPINGSVTDNYAARIMAVNATAPNLEIWMPPANQASVGQDALFKNVGTETFTVKDFSGLNTIISILPGEAKYVYLTANPDEQGTWENIAFGVGSSSADAATLAGYGLLATGLTLNQSHPVVAFSSDNTASLSSRAKTLVWTGGAGTLTLDQVTTLGDNWFVLVRNAGTGALTVQPSSGSLINGSGSVVFQPTDSAIVVCSGSVFYTVGLGKSTQFNFTQLTKDVAAGGTFVLTPTEASNVIQKYTGTLVGNVTIIVPPTVQVYYVLNNTIGGPSGYTLTITTGLGASAIITAGEQSTLVCDSVNIYNANTVLAGATTLSIQNGSAGAPSLNFASETSTGIFHAVTGEFNIAVLGTGVVTVDTGGMSVNGSGNFVGGISGGTF